MDTERRSRPAVEPHALSIESRPRMSAWTELNSRIAVRQSRAYRMNSAVVARDGHALVFDPGVLPSEMTDIAARVTERAPRPEQVGVIYTHPHWDHVLGQPYVAAATTLAHADFAGELARDEAAIERSARAWIEAAGESWPRAFRAFAPTLVVRGTARVQIGPFAVVAHEIPGHCASQIALHLPDEGLLIAGDVLSDIEIPWLDGPPWVYRRSLTAILEVLAQHDVRWLVPGHGSVAEGRLEGQRRVLRDIDYLLALEQATADARERGRSLEQAQAELERMDYLGKDAEYAMNGVHRDNVAFVYRALADAPISGDAP
jgi:glyoxylase-like metal-dependent hydrolase (beta-lactamase superfamily II)